MDESEIMGVGELVIPDMNSEFIVDGEQLKSNDIEDKLLKSSITNINLAETTDIDMDSYLIDITGVEVSKAMLLAIKGLLNGGETTVYIKTNTDNQIKIGSGDPYTLYMILEDLIRVAYDGKCRVYKNTGKGFKEVSITDSGYIRLKL